MHLFCFKIFVIEYVELILVNIIIDQLVLYWWQCCRDYMCLSDNICQRIYEFLLIIIGHSLTSIILYRRLTLLSWYYCKSFIIPSIYLEIWAKPNSSTMFLSFTIKTSYNSSIYYLILPEIRYFSWVFYFYWLFLYLYMITLPVFLHFLLFKHILYYLTFILYLLSIIIFCLLYNYGTM